MIVRICCMRVVWACVVVYLIDSHRFVFDPYNYIVVHFRACCCQRSGVQCIAIEDGDPYHSWFGLIRALFVF